MYNLETDPKVRQYMAVTSTFDLKQMNRFTTAPHFETDLQPHHLSFFKTYLKGSTIDVSHKA